jgi:hypothetical protein
MALPTLSSDQFHAIPLANLGQWVIWQFPELGQPDCLYCAVRSTAVGAFWWPGCLSLPEQMVYVYTAVDTPFPTPEAAVAYLKTKDEG